MSSPLNRAFIGAGLSTLAFAFVSLAGLPQARSADVREALDFTIYQPYVSPRALGMGNAFTAVADDYSTLLYNPAGLARLTEGQINMGFGASLDSKFLKLKDDISKISGSDDPNAATALLQDNLGKHYSARLPQLEAFWVRPNWGLAIIPVDLSMDIEFHQLATYSMNLVATQDTTIAYGRGWDLHWLPEGHRLSMGVTGKAIYRGHYNKAFLASDLLEDSELLRPEDAKEGFTADADFGMLWTPSVSETSAWRFARPTLGFTVRNVADYGFNSNFHLIDKNSGKPPKLGRRFDVGTMFELPDWWVFRSRLMADMRDMGHENFSFNKGAHLGLEFLWKIRSWWQGGWRVGVNQGYFTAGFTGKFGIFNLDLVTYGDEVGPSDAAKSVRKYMAKASLDW